MNILFLSQFFTPEPFFKALPFAKGLARRGHRVEVLTGFPNYPGGKIYPGYHLRPWQTEYLEGIRLTRVALYPSHDQSPVHRALNYMSFALSATLLGPFFAGRPDIVYVYHPPITTGVPACVLRALRGVPFVYDIQDLWPDTIAVLGGGVPRLAMSLLDRWCSFVYRQAAHITVVSPGVRAALIQRGVPDNKVSVIYNWCDEDNIHPVSRNATLARRFGLAGRFNVMFAGTMGLAQSLDTVLDAAGLCAAVNPGVQFVFVGAGVERARLQAKAAREGLRNVLFLPSQPIEMMAPVLSLADVLLVHLKDDPLFQITIPSKTQTIFAAAKPILMAVAGDASTLVESARAGCTIPPENPQQMADAVLAMASMSPECLRTMGACGRSFYLREMSMETGIDRFEQLFQTVSRTRQAAPQQIAQ